MSKPGILFNELIDQYKLDKHLAQRRVTDYYLALDVDENETVAIEILLPSLANHQSYVERFISKQQSVSRLNHPHIAKVFQVGIAPNKRPYFAREFVDGIPLSHRIAELAKQEHPVNSIYALKLVRQIADALALAERLDIFHYDLQPDNIFLQPDGKIMLVDLGIPRVKKVDPSNFLGGTTFDSRYWSLEQIQNRALDARSHVYSLGIILFELLTGHVIPPQMATKGRLGFLSGGSTLEKLRPDLSYETVRLVQKALRATLAGRFGNSAEFLVALDEAIEAEELALHSGTAVRRPQSTARLLIAVGLPLLLLLIGGLGFLIAANNRDPVVEIQPSSEPGAVAIVPSETSTPTEMSIALEPTLTPEVATRVVLQLLTPSQSAVVAGSGTINFSWRWEAPLEQNQEFAVYGFSNGTQIELERINTPTSGNTYEISVPVSTLAAQGESLQWQVVLLSSITQERIAESDLRPLNLTFLATETPTATLIPTVTPSATPTLTPTPLPRVVINVSSASLRTGPSPRFPILRFLEAGDEVWVLAKLPDGTWWNVMTEDGTVGWMTTLAAEGVGESNLTAVPTAATVPPEPTVTPSPIPTITPTFTPTPPTGSGGGGGGSTATPPPSEPPTKTPPPP